MNPGRIVPHLISLYYICTEILIIYPIMTLTSIVTLSLLPSGSEWIIILVVILLLFGGKKIPELMRGLGKGVKSFKQGVDEAKEEINKAKEEINEPVEKKQQ